MLSFLPYARDGAEGVPVFERFYRGIVPDFFFLPFFCECISSFFSKQPQTVTYCIHIPSFISPISHATPPPHQIVQICVFVFFFFPFLALFWGEGGAKRRFHYARTHFHFGLAQGRKPLILIF